MYPMYGILGPSQPVKFFQTQKKCVGNGEEKLAAELKIEQSGGQNNTVDLFHPTIGKISVKI